MDAYFTDLADISMGHYRTIYADPPWPETGAGVRGGRRGADRHYRLMSFSAIAALPVAMLADPEGCHLWLWVTNRFLEYGLETLGAWGFEYRNIVTWHKEGRFGLGQYVRGTSEQCLFGIRGMLPYRTRPDGKRAQGLTCFDAPRVGGHSAKPVEMRRMVELVSHPPRLELFARTVHDGWDAWGDAPPDGR